jgi:antitoxin VapB
VADAVKAAIEEQARAVGVAADHPHPRRMSAEKMLAFGSEVAAMPLLDLRSPHEIMDDINAA